MVRTQLHLTEEARLEMLRELAGIWKDRPVVPDFTEVRGGWDRDNADRS